MARWRDINRVEQGLAPDAYAAVLALRRAGHTVRCARRTAGGAETHHELDGAIVPTSWLMDMARIEQQPTGGAHE